MIGRSKISSVILAALALSLIADANAVAVQLVADARPLKKAFDEVARRADHRIAVFAPGFKRRQDRLHMLFQEEKR